MEKCKSLLVKKIIFNICINLYFKKMSLCLDKWL